MKITARDLERLGIVDKVIEEPPGGAHRHPAATIVAVGEAVAASLEAMRDLPADEIRTRRQQKFLAIGRNL
jgi:acetyl-CoA carboxylase carboxyl transferase subunit alpha